MKYDFHGLFGLSAQDEDFNDSLFREFHMFESSHAAIDLNIVSGRIEEKESLLFKDYEFDDASFVVNEKGGRIELRNKTLTFEKGVDHEYLILGLILPIMKYASIAQGATIVHASAVSRRGHSLLFPAWGGTGKTNMLLTFLLRSYDYVSDDWVFLSESGHSLAFPRHISILDEHLQVFPDVFDRIEDKTQIARLRRTLRKLQFGKSIRGDNFLSRNLRHFFVSRNCFNPRIAPERIGRNISVRKKSKISKVFLLKTSRAEVEISRIELEKVKHRLVAMSTYEWSANGYMALQLARAYAQGMIWNPIMMSELEILERALCDSDLYEISLPAKLTKKVLESLADRIEDI